MSVTDASQEYDSVFRQAAASLCKETLGLEPSNKHVAAVSNFIEEEAKDCQMLELINRLTGEHVCISNVVKFCGSQQ